MGTKSPRSRCHLCVGSRIHCQAVLLKRDRLDAEVRSQAIQVGALQVGHLCADRGGRDREHTIIVSFEICPLLNEPSRRCVVFALAIQLTTLRGM